MSACLDCGGSECVCRAAREARALRRIVAIAIEAACDYGDLDWEDVKETLRREGLHRMWEDMERAFEADQEAP